MARNAIPACGSNCAIVSNDTQRSPPMMAANAIYNTCICTKTKYLLVAQFLLFFFHFARSLPGCVYLPQDHGQQLNILNIKKNIMNNTRFLCARPAYFICIFSQTSNNNNRRMLVHLCVMYCDPFLALNVSSDYIASEHVCALWDIRRCCVLFVL